MLPYDVIVHIVLDDFGRSGRAYRETEEDHAEEKHVIDDMLSGEFKPSGTCCIVQHGRGLVAGRIRGYCAGRGGQGAARGPRPASEHTGIH